MKKIDVVQLISILSELGVIAGIVFLAVEIRQNNAMVLSQTRSDISYNVSTMLRQQSTSEYFDVFADAEAVKRAGSLEALRYQNWFLATLRMWENANYQWTRGLFEDDEYEKEKAIWARNIERSRERAIFCQFRDAFRDDFVEELESMMEQPCRTREH